MQRKTSCELDAESAARATFKCPDCDKTYSRSDNLAHHAKKHHAEAACAAVRDVPDVALMSDQIRQMTVCIDQLKQQLAVLAPSAPIQTANTINNTVNNINNTVNININVVDGPDGIALTCAQLVAAAIADPTIMEYVSMSSNDQVDSDKVRRHVAHMMVTFARHAHEDPAARNVRLNPNRADQAMVYTSPGRWEVRTLEEAIRIVLDGVEKRMRPSRIASAPLDIQGGVSMGRMVYNEDADACVKQAKPALVGHLTDMAQRVEPAAGQCVATS